MQPARRLLLSSSCANRRVAVPCQAQTLKDMGVEVHRVRRPYECRIRPSYMMADRTLSPTQVLHRDGLNAVLLPA